MCVCVCVVNWMGGEGRGELHVPCTVQECPFFQSICMYVCVGKSHASIVLCFRSKYADNDAGVPLPRVPLVPS